MKLKEDKTVWILPDASQAEVEAFGKKLEEMDTGSPNIVASGNIRIFKFKKGEWIEVINKDVPVERKIKKYLDAWNRVWRKKK